MEVTKGYKHTDVGVIPADWDVKPFADLFTFRNGVNSDKEAYGQGVGFINVLEPITYSHIRGPEITGKVTLPESVIQTFTVRRGDVLFNRTSETLEEVALAATYLGDERVVFGGFVIRARLRYEAFDPVYSGYALRAPFIRSQIVPMGQGAVRANVGQQSLGCVVAPIPPLREQRAIAEALGDVDELIGSLERLIAKKRDIKQAVMQQLLTGKTRLPGFTGDWKTWALGDLGEVSGSGVDKKVVEGQEPVRLVNYMDAYLQNKIFGRMLTHWVTGKPEQVARCRVQRGDIFFTPSSETRDDIANSAVAMEDIPDAAYSYHVVRLRLKADWDLRFRGYAFKSREFLRQAEMLCDGSGTRYVISLQKFRGMTIRVPLPEEQAAIAEVLDDIDSELVALELRLAKTREIKQGMMQQLLTGKVRLV